MADDALTAHDDLAGYCPKLGHEVTFRYCRMPAAPLPCRNIAGCWKRAFDVDAFLAGRLTAAQMEKMKAPPPDRASTLIELIQQAQCAAASQSKEKRDSNG